jgi:hypothetical protein
MGEMADWAFDQIIWEESDKSSYINYYLGLDDATIATEIKEALTDRNYDYDGYTELMVSIYMAVQCGYALTDKQKRAVATHLWSQGMDNWY